MLSTVSKEFIKPTQVMHLPFIDTNIEYVTIAIKTDKEAYKILKEIRGY